MTISNEHGEMSEDSKTGSRCEFRTYHTIRKKDSETTKRISDPFGKQGFSDSDIPFALVIKRLFVYESSSEPQSTKLRINSPHLLEAFRHVVKSYATAGSDFTAPFELSSPFQMLVHYWDELEEYQKQTKNAAQRMHLKLLFEFMDHELGADREVLRGMLQNEQITYLNAWVIFRPGDIMHTDIMGHGWLLRCQKTVYEESTRQGPFLEVHCTYTDHDGSIIGQAVKKIVIYQKRQFGGENPAFITDLPVYPRRFVKEGDELEKRLEERGRKFLGLVGMSTQAYDGLAQYLRQPPWDFWHPDMASFDDVWLPYTESGRVIVDRKTFQSELYSSQVGIKKVSVTEPLLSPPFSLGYSISRKCWCRFFIDNLGNVQWKTGLWKSLVLEEKQKRVLHALVKSHRYPDNPRNQPEQKGKGLVVLLHGSPGSGKTLTAEVSAEETEKPLISTSLGDLNKENRPSLFEQELRRILQYATLWKAVVLLDEADVFLEKRNEQAGNAERNSLVAVFLRELEYFSGVVFLTTNRLASFDQAMKSRIHLALGYGPPGIDVRRSIWIQNLQRIPADESDIGDDLDDAVDSIVGQNLNGREISNAINTARTIALFEGVKLKVEHIEEVLNVRATFNQALETQVRKLEKASTNESSATFHLARQGSILEEVDG